MIDEHRFAADRIAAVGYGEFRPHVRNTGPGNRSRNRRVDFVVLRDDAASETAA
jgi:chemotaxis protein MotB